MTQKVLIHTGQQAYAVNLCTADLNSLPSTFAFGFAAMVHSRQR